MRDAMILDYDLHSLLIVEGTVGEVFDCRDGMPVRARYFGGWLHKVRARLWCLRVISKLER